MKDTGNITFAVTVYVTPVQELHLTYLNQFLINTYEKWIQNYGKQERAVHRY